MIKIVNTEKVILNNQADICKIRYGKFAFFKI